VTAEHVAERESPSADHAINWQGRDTERQASPRHGSTASVLLGLQRSHGNTAVTHLVDLPRPTRGSGRGVVQRAPRGVQRAPDDAGRTKLGIDARVDRLILGAIKPGWDKFIIDYDKVDELLSGLSAADGRTLIEAYRQRRDTKGWDLEKILAGTVEFDPDLFAGQFRGLTERATSARLMGEKLVVDNDLGPLNRKRLLERLRGTTPGEQLDPNKAMAAVQAVGDVAEAFGISVDEKAVQSLSANVAVAVRDQNLREQAEATKHLRAAETIQLKSWIDRGQNEKAFAFLKKLATGAADERTAFIEEFPRQTGIDLYLYFTQHLEGADFQRAAALYMGDVTGAERAALKGELKRYQNVKEKLDKIPEPDSPSGIFGAVAGDSTLDAATRQLFTERLQAERGKLEAHVAALRKETVSEAGTPAGQTRLKAVLARDREGDELSSELGVEPAPSPAPAGSERTTEVSPAAGVSTAGRSTPATASRSRPTTLTASDRALVSATAQAETPVLLAKKLRVADREGHLKGSDIEAAFIELQDAAVTEARRRIDATPKLQKEGQGARYEQEVVKSFFTYFRSSFDLENPARPLSTVLSTSGTSEDRARSQALFEGGGKIPEWRDLDISLRYEKKDYDRVKQILSHKTRKQVERVKAEYNDNAVGVFGLKRDLQTDLLGTSEYQYNLRHPEHAPPEFLQNTDINEAREEYEERKSWLQGDTYEPEPPTQADDTLSPPQTTDEPARAPGLPTSLTQSLGGPPAPGLHIAREAMALNQQRDALRREAWWLFGRITGVYSRTIDNRGTFARFHDWVGNTERHVVNETRDAALDAFRVFDRSLDADPPNLELAREQINKLYLVQARMDYNVPAYKEATEAAFNEFVDFAVLVVSSLVTFGEGGAIIMAIRATVATVLTKATLKGGDYSADEFWGDIKGGALSAVGGKLGDQLVDHFAAAYLAKATKLGWKNTWIGAAERSIPGAVKQHVRGLVGGEITAVGEAVTEGDASRLLDPLDPKNQAIGVGQGLVHRGMHKVGGAIGGRRPRAGDEHTTRPSPLPHEAAPTPRAEARVEEGAARVEEENEADVQTQPEQTAMALDEMRTHARDSAPTPAGERKAPGAPEGAARPRPGGHEMGVVARTVQAGGQGRRRPAAESTRERATTTERTSGGSRAEERSREPSQDDIALVRRDADARLRRAEESLRRTELEQRDAYIREAAEREWEDAYRARSEVYAGGRGLEEAVAGRRRAVTRDNLRRAEDAWELYKDDPIESPLRRAAEARLLGARKAWQQSRGTWAEPPPLRWDEEMVVQLREPTNAREHEGLFQSLVDQDPTREVGLFRNSTTGELIVVRGKPTTVSVETNAGGEQGPRGAGAVQRWKEILSQGSDVGHWELVAHSHPSPRKGAAAPLEAHYPSGGDGDYGVLVHDSIQSGWQPKTSVIFYETPQGRRATFFGVDFTNPEPYWYKIWDGTTHRFQSLDAYHNHLRWVLGVDIGPAPPNMPVGSGLGMWRPDMTLPRVPQTPMPPVRPEPEPATIAVESSTASRTPPGGSRPAPRPDVEPGGGPAEDEQPEGAASEPAISAGLSDRIPRIADTSSRAGVEDVVRAPGSEAVGPAAHTIAGRSRPGSTPPAQPPQPRAGGGRQVSRIVEGKFESPSGNVQELVPPPVPPTRISPRKNSRGRWTGLPETVPAGIVYEFPNGARVWRTPDGSIAIESGVAPGPGRAGYERTLPARGEYDIPEYQEAMYELAHSQGQGTGNEAPFAIALAPRIVNQAYQRWGVEEFLYQLRDRTPAGMTFRLLTNTRMYPGTRRLMWIEYRVEAVQGVRPPEPFFSFRIEVTGDPGRPNVRPVDAELNPTLQDLLGVPDMSTPFRMQAQIIQEMESRPRTNEEDQETELAAPRSAGRGAGRSTPRGRR
jgi:hypothetical protein